MSGGPFPDGVGLHATAVIFGEAGVMITGPPGAGKSALALALLDRARGSRRFGALVGDDRVWARLASGRIVLEGAAGTAGRIERRGVGVVTARSEPRAIARLLVELAAAGESWPRLPPPNDSAVVAGAILPRLALDFGISAPDRAAIVDYRLSELAADRWRRIDNSP